ncbi:DUF2231 domain-containing protein [Arthrobacter sp. Sr33]
MEPNPYLRLVHGLEQNVALDRAVDLVEPFASQLVAYAPIRRMFHGDATGLPLHPVLTDVPFGAWFMADFLDFFPDEGSRRAATRLVGLGVVSAAPTALTGWAEWALSDPGTRRVGVVHASANAVAVLIFAGSWLARRRNRHSMGIGLARLGSVFLVVGGFLGGHMSTRARAVITDPAGVNSSRAGSPDQ